MSNRMHLKLLRFGWIVLLLGGCAAPYPGRTPVPNVSTPSNPPALSVLPQGAQVVFFNGIILTIDESRPRAQAVLIQGESIVAVGDDSEVLAQAGPGAVRIDLEGKVLIPGFIDAHQHRIGDSGKLGHATADPLIEAAIEQGWTTIDELYVDEGRLNGLRDLDQAGALRLRVNAYLAVMENSPEGRRLGGWYAAYAPGQSLSPHVRVAGLKVFTDYDNARILLWNQEDLNAFLFQEHRNGWQLAIKTVSTRSLEMILTAVESIEQADSNIVNERVRLEHALFITPEQIARIQRLGLIPVINLNNPGQLVGEADVDELIAREPQGSYTPWRSLFQAGIPAANGTGFPSYYVDEPSGAPFGSPMHLIYQGVTRVGNLGRQPYPWLLDQTVTAEEALQALTINAAFASREEDIKGSISPGKLADLAILSEDPLSVSAEGINNIRVLMTMIGGKVEWCGPGSEALCPDAAPAPAGAPDPFIGAWAATDPADGSSMSLEIGRAGDTYNVILVDDKAGVCGLDAAGQPSIAARIAAPGLVNGNVLSTSVTTIECLSDPPTSLQRSLTLDYTYQSATDTLLDSSGAVWRRP